MMEVQQFVITVNNFYIPWDGKGRTLARFLLFFYSIDIDRLEVDLGYICDRDPNFSKGVTVELE